jgi:hypothetical protein
MLNDDFLLIKQMFNTNYNSFKKYLKESGYIKNFDVVWSSSYLDFHQYESEIDQIKKPKIYSKIPESKDGLIMNKIKDGQIFYACQYNHEDWGSVFYLYNDHNKTKLMYNAENEDEKMLLVQIHHLVTDGELIQKSLYYMRDEEQDEETFFQDKYEYDENKIFNHIIRNGFYKNKENNLPTRIFRFEYTNNKVIIYSKQENINGNLIEEQIYPKRR